ncbi:MAG: NPCBM/NEW2 domain-containing protein, partial [Opitutales bacterium]|nr:NPCBM/NEW2 domain-containing protein [Opitutales bacterium]
GPARFEAARAGIFLEYGKVYAHVSETGQGFTVDTPHTRFIDLGTEFGIEVTESNSSELHVLEGKVQVYAGKDGKTMSSRTAYTNEAFRFEAESGQLYSVPIDDKRFARYINSRTKDIWRGKSLSLADMVAGGNGFGTGRADKCICPLTGNFIIPVYEYAYESSYFPLREVDESMFIDSVFVPDGGEGQESVISSTGTFCLSFPDTSGVAWTSLRSHPYDKSSNEDGYTRPYDPESENKAIYMHSNIGITFDLEQIRQYFDDQIEVSSLSFEYGFRKHYSIYGEKEHKVDLRVLADGVELFLKENVPSDFDRVVVDLSLEPGTRFLSLAVTESDDTPSEDWAVFINPELVLLKK